MDPLLKNVNTHTLRPLNPQDAVTFASTDEQYELPTGGQLVLTDMHRFTDVLGETIHEKSILARCGVTGQLVHLHSCHRCVDCRRICSGPTLKKRASEAYLFADGLNTGEQIAPILGFCSDCWAKFHVRLKYRRKELLRLLTNAILVLFRPIRAISDDRQPEFLPPSFPAQEQPPLSEAQTTSAIIVPVPPPTQPPQGATPQQAPAAPESDKKPKKKPSAKLSAILLILLLSGGPQALSHPAPTSQFAEPSTFKEVILVPEEIEPLEELPVNTSELLKLTNETLEIATRLGMDLPSAHPVDRGMYLVVKRKLDNGQVDPIRLRILCQRVEKRKKEVRECVLLFEIPKPEDIASGDLQFMTTYPTGLPVYRPHDSFALGCQIYSNTAQGKSTLIYRIVESWMQLKNPAVIVALKPDGFFSALSRSFPDRVLYYKAGEPVYNAFAPVTGDAIQFIREKLEYWQSCYQRWDSAAILARVLERFDEDRRLHGEAVPKLKWILETLREIHLPKNLFNPALKPSVFGCLDLMNKGLLGRTMDCIGINWDIVMSKGLTVILELHGLSDADYHFFTASLMADIRAIRENNSSLPPIMFAVDEADALCSERWDSHPHIGPFSAEMPLCRSAGLYTVFAAHNPAKCSPQVKSNSGMTFVSALSSGTDIAAGGTTAAMPPENHHSITLLPPFTAILKITGEGYPLPFLVTWKRPDGLTPLTEDERLEANARITAQYPDLFLSAAEPSSAAKSSATYQSSLDNETLVLNDLHRRPFLSVTERLDDFILSDGKQTDFDTLTGILRSLHGRGYCDPVKVRMVKGRAGTSFYWILTAKACKTLGVQPIPARAGTGHQHAWAQKFIHHLLAKQGINAQIEPKSSNSQPDLGFEHKDKKIAVEVCLSTHSSEYAKIRRTLMDWDYVLLVCLMPDDRNTLEKDITNRMEKDDTGSMAKVSICQVFHLLEPDLAPVYSTPDLVYDDPKCRTKKSRRTKHA